MVRKFRHAPRPGKDLAVAGLAAAVVLLLLLFVTSGAFFGVVCLVLGIAALLLGLLGLKTEGRAIAFAGAGAGLLAILLSIGQIRSATRKPDPRDELTLENTAAVASQATAQMAVANNARIEAVEPVLKEAGITTKTIELPDGVRLLLTELPDGRFMGTFEVTQAQYASLMGRTSPSASVLISPSIPFPCRTALPSLIRPTNSPL